MVMMYTINEYIWVVGVLDKEYGVWDERYWFTDQSKADKCAKAISGRVCQRTLYLGNDGKYYRIAAVEVPVDAEVHRQSALAKLTAEERAALGVK